MRKSHKGYLAAAQLRRLAATNPSVAFLLEGARREHRELTVTTSVAAKNERPRECRQERRNECR